MENLKIEYVDINSIKPYKNNAKEHPKEQIEQIKKSIERFGMDDPIGIWKDEIVEGHGRLIACKELGMKKVPIIRLDHLSDEERKAYTLAHNKLTMNSDFDIDILKQELESISNINMQDFGFNLDFNEEQIVSEEENPYTAKIEIPHYEITGKEPDIKDLYDDTKTKQLIDKINNSEAKPEIKDFLIKAAQRHLVFNYSNIAEFYAHQNKEVQELMEESALVIIDTENAIRNGYMELIKGIDTLIEQESDNYDE